MFPFDVVIMACGFYARVTTACRFWVDIMRLGRIGAVYVLPLLDMKGLDGSTCWYINSLDTGDVAMIFDMKYSNSFWWYIGYFLWTCPQVAAMRLLRRWLALVQVTAWCRQEPGHYLGKNNPRSMSPYGVTRPQWVRVWTKLWLVCKLHLQSYISWRNIFVSFFSVNWNLFWRVQLTISHGNHWVR